VSNEREVEQTLHEREKITKKKARGRGEGSHVFCLGEPEGAVFAIWEKYVQWLALPGRGGRGVDELPAEGSWRFAKSGKKMIWGPKRGTAATRVL